MAAVTVTPGLEVVYASGEVVQLPRQPNVVANRSHPALAQLTVPELRRVIVFSLVCTASARAVAGDGQ